MIISNRFIMLRENDLNASWQNCSEINILCIKTLIVTL